jgi:hypothetical protein
MSTHFLAAKATLLLLTLCLLAPGAALAGWVIEEKSARGESRTTRIQDNVWLTEAEGLVSVFDAGRGLMTFMKPGRRIYWSGTPEEFRAATLDPAADPSVKSQLEALPPLEREALRQKMAAMMDRMTAGGPKHEYAVKATRDAGAIAGHAAKRFELTRDGRKVEDLWLAQNLGIEKEFDAARMMAMWRAMLPPGADLPKYSVGVMELMSRGFVLKTVEYDPKGRPVELWEAVSVQKAGLPPEAFAVPADFRPADIYAVLN